LNDNLLRGLHLSERIKNLTEKYAKILGVDDQIFGFHEGTEVHQADLGWDEERGIWIINYDNEDVNESYIAHEVGHIFLAKKFGFDGFAKPMRDEDAPKIDWNIPLLLNMCLDGFVDYHISQFSTIYPCLKVKYFSYVEDLQNTFSYIEENTDYIEVLSWYILWFQIFNFIIDRASRFKYKDEIAQLFSYTKNHLLKFKGGMDSITFGKFIDTLKKFKEIKKTDDPKQIILYSTNVILSCGFWDRTKVLKHMRFFFPTIRDLFKKSP
jgi:hypothetical protein